MSTAPPSSLGPTDPASLDADARHVLHALALGATSRTRAWLLSALSRRQASGRAFTAEALRLQLDALARQGWAAQHPARDGYWQVASERVGTAYLDLLASAPEERLRTALMQADGLSRSPFHGSSWWSFPNLDAACALTRLTCFAGQPRAVVARLETGCGWGTDWAAVIERAVHDVLDDALLTRLHPEMRVDVLDTQLDALVTRWVGSDRLDARAQAQALLAQSRQDPALQSLVGSSALPLRLAECHLLAGRWDDASAALSGDGTPAPDHPSPRSVMRHVVAGYRCFRQGDWPGAITAFEAAMTGARTLSGKRKGLLPPSLGWSYPLALMAAGEPKHLAQATRVCLAESGRRQVIADSPWGVLALAIQMRDGEVRRDLAAFLPHGHAPYLHPLDFTRWMARAWLKDQPGADPALTPSQREAGMFMARQLATLGLTDLADQMSAALHVLAGRPAPGSFFVASAPEGWRSTLAALARIGQPASGATGTVIAPETRLIWTLTLNDYGALLDMAPRESRQGVRGWSKPKDVPLSRLVKQIEALAPHDAAVARTIRISPRDRSQRLDLVAAATALVGHPHVEFDDTPGVAVTLTEAGPELDVTDLGERLRITLVPPPRWADPQADRQEPQLWVTTAAEQKEADALQVTTVVRDTPQAARLIRLNDAQKRAAQLIGAGLEVPREAMPQLDEVLRSLGAQFRIHSDAGANAREVIAETRLRAELTPEGDGLTLRLVVAPFGPGGPRVNPGSGRTRLIAAVDGETLAARRDLAAERSHVETVLDACPMLAPLPAELPSQWTVEQPEAALALLERLHTLNAVTALDWPKGRAIRVDAVGLGALQVNVKSGSEWLVMAGGVTLDERLVFSLGKLLDWSAHQKSRFVPLGDGRYLALTEELRARLDDLASIAEVHRGDQARLTPLAAAWLDTTLRGADVDTDIAFRERIDRLVEAQQHVPALPRTLQATLRPYQEEGYQWAMRLAATGLGAILADDMGLGKTLQALAVLLARAAGGPALVVAPTSLIGNWLAEARRFAPALVLKPYADGDAQGDRDALLADLQPHDVVLVSYQLQQLNAEAFAARRWHTLVLDEAQAIKNASAKRSQAVHDLGADFRLALSGTPIENRLAELWSIMRVCNPGLLGSLNVFNLRFAVPIERDRSRPAQRTLRRLIAPFILRRTKAQVLDDLPPRTELLLTVQGDTTEQAHYEALRRQALKEAEEALSGDRAGQAHLNILAQLTKLRRAACDPRLVTPDLALTGAKVRAFGELAQELAANGHKALVFSQFVDFLQLLKAPLDTAGLRYQYLDGATPAAERTKRVAAFQDGDGDFFLISLKAGGFGLNLTVADYVVIADPWWNPAAEDQASGRAHRIGQQRPVTVYRLVHQGTLEEKILALHQDKRELADSVLDGSETAGVLRAEELMALMQGD
jgi:superfamily II DNA or RNA helicase